MQTIKGIENNITGMYAIVMGGDHSQSDGQVDGACGNDATMKFEIRSPIPKIAIATIVAQTSVCVYSYLGSSYMWNSPLVKSYLKELKLFSNPNDFSAISIESNEGEEMSLDDKFKEEMKDICEEYHNLLKEKKLIEEQLETLHDYLEVTMRKYEKEEYDEPEVPVKVDKIVYTSERMKKGAKAKLREILTTKQWSEIYKEKEVISYRVSIKDD